MVESGISISNANPQLQLAYDFVQSTGEHVFLTGKAGTGKTTFLRSLETSCSKRMIVVAPTGVAALNAGGVTIHSFFQLPLGPIVPEGQGQDDRLGRRFTKTKINIIRSLDLLVIDEISMVRADLLDGVDMVLRRYRDRERPFGGVQLLMIGDLQQLAPVITEEDWPILSRYYEMGFFFGSQALRQTSFVTIELQHIYRQRDERFITLLNKIRDNQLDSQAHAELNARYRPDYVPPQGDGTIVLTTHNAQAQRLNEVRMAALSTQTRTFHAQVEGDFSEFLYPTEAELTLKVGAQVMFVKNDSSQERRYFNGKIGALKRFEEEGLVVKCPEDDEAIYVTSETWQNAKYSLDEETKAIQEEIVGRFTQIPLKPAWAITIHKSQGLTFDKAVIDAQAVFAHGQVYVALSRCRSLEGLVLSTPIRAQGLPTDAHVQAFSRDVSDNPPGPDQLAQARQAFALSLVLDLFDFNCFHRLLARIIKRINENARSLPRNPIESFMDLGRELREHVTGVAEKFHAQIRAMNVGGDIESNAALQERIRKGCAYFMEKIDTLLIAALEKVSVETDNQAVRKRVEEAVDALLGLARRKRVCLDASAQGFVTATYLKARAEAAVDTSRPRARRRAEIDAAVAYLDHPELYRRLKAWRQEKARFENVPPNTLITLRTLIEITKHLPCSRVELKRIHGIGKKTLARIGAEVLDLVYDYIGLEEEEIVELEPPPKPRITGDTKRISLDLFCDGKKVAEIAEHRQLTISTIEGHLAHFVRSGDLPLEKVVPLTKAQPAITFFKKADIPALSPAKEEFGERYTYGELRMIVNHLQYTGVIEG